MGLLSEENTAPETGAQGQEGGNDDQNGGFVPPEGKEWLSGVDPELATDPSLQSIQDIPTLVKSYVHAQKMVGKDKVIVPDQNSSDEEWKAFYRKVGLPESKEDYAFETPEGFLSEDAVNQIKDLAYDLNLLPHQVEGLLKAQAEIMQSDIAAREAEEEALIEESIEALKQELGEEGFIATLRNAKTVVEEFGGEEFMEYLEETGLDNDPEMIKFLGQIGESLNEDTFQPDAVEHLGITKQDAEEEIAKIMGDDNSPYWNENHANHDRVVKRVAKLYEILAK